jgi:hypothetical protein
MLATLTTKQDDIRVTLWIGCLISVILPDILQDFHGFTQFPKFHGSTFKWATTSFEILAKSKTSREEPG